MRLDRQWAAEAYAAGWTVRDIAAECNVDESTVHRALTALGVERRVAPGRTDWSTVLTREWLATVTHLSHAEAAEAAGMIDATSPKSQRASAGSIMREWRATHGLADPLDAQTRQRLRQWYEAEGLTVREVGARLGLGRRATAERLRAAGVALRPRGRRAQ